MTLVAAGSRGPKSTGQRFLTAENWDLGFEPVISESVGFLSVGALEERGKASLWEGFEGQRGFLNVSSPRVFLFL